MDLDAYEGSLLLLVLLVHDKFVEFVFVLLGVVGWHAIEYIALAWHAEATYSAQSLSVNAIRGEGLSQ